MNSRVLRRHAAAALMAMLPIHPVQAPEVTLDVSFFDPSGLLRGQREELQEEVERIIHDASIDVHWLPAGEILESKDGRLPLRATLVASASCCRRRP